MLMKWFAYALCVVGFLLVLFGSTAEQLYGGAIMGVFGVVVWVVYHLVQRVDPDGSDEL